MSMDDEGSTTSRTGARATAAQKTTRVSARGKKIAILVAGMHRSGASDDMISKSRIWT